MNARAHLIRSDGRRNSRSSVTSSMMMLSRISAVAVVTSGALVAASPGDAATKLHGDRGAVSQAIAVPDSSRVVMLAAEGKLQVSSPGRASRTIVVPARCSLQAAMTDREAFVCGGAEGDPIAVDLITGAQRALPARTSLGTAKERFYVTRAGKHWLAGRVEMPDEQFAGGETVSVDVIVNRKTGREIAIANSDRQRYLDLDAASPWRTVCAPIKRSRSGKLLLDLISAGTWTVRETPNGRQLLQRCGAHRSVSLGSSETIGPLGLQVVLSRTHAAWIVDHDTVMLRNLATGRTRSYSPDRLATVRIALSSQRLIVSQSQSGKAWNVATVPLD